MKYLIFIFILCPPLMASAQHVTNPDTIYQPKDIYLQHTDVYYTPATPPDPTDTDWNLSCIASELRDPNGVHSYTFEPRSHGIPLITVWMRLFTAMNKLDGSTSDIVVGDSITNDTTPGEVIISNNEDVDFRATGDIRMEAGFHVMPGAQFHAYIAPSRDSLIFHDEFDSSVLSPQWVVTNGHGGNATSEANCSSDSNVHTGVVDTEAHDGFALRIDLKEDSCNCYEQGFTDVMRISGHDTTPGCSDIPSSTLDTYQFKTGILLSCPFPFNHAEIPYQPVSDHSPYGIYEVREKAPFVKHHTNNWGDGQSDEWNLGETYGGDMSLLRPGITHRWTYGPYKGVFSGDTLRSSSANFAPWNSPTHIIINNFLYEVQLQLSTHPIVDTFLLATGTTHNEGGFPSSLTSSTDSVSFYYTLWSGYGIGANHISDTVAWSIDPTGTYFTGPYAVNHGDSLYFTKSYQPSSITLLDSTYPCYWDHDSLKIHLRTPFDSSAPHSVNRRYSYITDEGPDYPVPGVPVDTNTYYGRYHTYTMELFPYEARFLVDGAVVRRWPDRMIPKDDQRYINLFPRTPMNIRLAQFEIDNGEFSIEKADFESKFGVGGTASHFVDYMKIWDIPKNMTVPAFPH